MGEDTPSPAGGSILDPEADAQHCAETTQSHSEGLGFCCCSLLLDTTEIPGLSLGSSLGSVTGLGPCLVWASASPSGEWGAGETNDFCTPVSSKKGRERGAEAG